MQQQQPGGYPAPSVLPVPPPAAVQPPAAALAPPQSGNIFWQGLVYYQDQAINRLNPVAEVQLISNKQHVLSLPWGRLAHISLNQMLSKDHMTARLVQLKRSSQYMLVPVSYRVVRAMQGLDMIKVRMEAVGHFTVI